MSDQLNRAFGNIKADETLKENTLAYIHQQAQAVQTKKKSPARRLVMAAACLLFILFAGGISYNLYFTPTAFVDVDVNPSIELSLNRFGRVLQSNAYNDDGDVLLSALQLRHKSYEAALDELLAAMQREGYLQQGGLLSVTIQSEQKESELLSSVQAYIDESLGANYLTLQQEVYSVDADTKAHSHDLGVSPARYLAISALQEVDPTVTVEGCRNHTISELREYTEAHGGGHRNGSGSNSGTAVDEEDTAETQQGGTGHHGEGGSGHGSGGHA